MPASAGRFDEGNTVELRQGKSRTRSGGKIPLCSDKDKIVVVNRVELYVRLPKRLSGAAGSSASACRQLGQSTGIALGGLLLGIGTARSDAVTPAAYALVGIAIAVVSVALLLLPSLYRNREA